MPTAAHEVALTKCLDSRVRNAFEAKTMPIIELKGVAIMANAPALLSTTPIGEPGKAHNTPSMVAKSECESVTAHTAINSNAHTRVGKGAMLIYSDLCSRWRRIKFNRHFQR